MGSNGHSTVPREGRDKPGIQGGDIIYLDSDRFEGTLVFALRCIRFRSE